MTVREVMDRLDDFLNPIVVKELRQAVQSRVVITVLLLFLGIQVFVLGIFLYLGTDLTGPTVDFHAGIKVFLALHTILLITCMFAIPIYAGVRLAAEHSDSNVDLLFISTLRPLAIVWGKLLSAVVLILLIFCTCAPFMTFTYLLRGIDIPTILVVLTEDFLGVLLGTQLALFLAAIPAARPLRIFLALVGLGALVPLLGIALEGTYVTVDNGIGSMADSWDFWAPAAGVLAVVLSMIILLFTWSVAVLSPPAANRALPGRVALVLIWLVTLGITLTWTAHAGKEWPIDIWMILTVTLLGLQIIISINERESWGNRLARTIPRNVLLRLPAFLLYSGAAGGVLLALGLLALTLILGQIIRSMLASPPSLGRGDEIFPVLLPFTFYIVAYSLSAVLVRRLVGTRRMPSLYTWVVGLVLLALGTFVPAILVLMYYAATPRMGPIGVEWMLTNPFAACAEMTSSQYRPDWEAAPPVLFSGLWAALALLINISWFFRQMGAFQPASVVIPLAEAVSEEPAPTGQTLAAASLEPENP